MIPPPSFPRVSFETREFLSEIKERFDLKSRALLKQVVWMIPPPDCQPEAGLRETKGSYGIFKYKDGLPYGRPSQVVG